MQPRRWDVVRSRARAATGVVALIALPACGQPSFIAAPEPQFTAGLPPVTTLPSPVSLPPVTAAEPDLDAIEADASGAGLLAAVDQLMLYDDAGNATPNDAGWAAFDAEVERRLIPADVSVGVAVMFEGQLVHEAAFGERVAGLGEPAAPSDRFRIGSISKTITAIVTLQLVDDGVLTLDDPVGQVLLDHLRMPQADPDVLGITVRELLSHSAGFPDHDGTFFGNGATSYGDAARIGLSTNVGGGGSYNYSNMSYAVLSVLIEAVTGKTYERVVGERLFGPLSIYGPRLTSTYEVGPDEVSHHPLPGRFYMEALGGAGAWNATPSDLVTILNSVDPATPGWKAVSPELMSMLRSRVPSELPPAGYGLGVINYSGGAWGHTGTIEHTHAMVVAESNGLTWAITVSGDAPGDSDALRGVMRAALASSFPAA